MMVIITLCSSLSIFSISFATTTGVTIGFVDESYTVRESDGEAVVRVAVLSGELSHDVVVGFNTQEDSATGVYR